MGARSQRSLLDGSGNRPRSVALSSKKADADDRKDADRLISKDALLGEMGDQGVVHQKSQSDQSPAVWTRHQIEHRQDTNLPNEKRCGGLGGAGKISPGNNPSRGWLTQGGRRALNTPGRDLLERGLGRQGRRHKEGGLWRSQLPAALG